MKPNLINTNKALKIAKDYDLSCTLPSLITWIEKYNLGYKVGGRWYIDKAKFKKFLSGEQDNENSGSDTSQNGIDKITR